VPEHRGAVVLVALRFARGDRLGLGQRVQVRQQVVGVGAGHVEPDVPVHRPEALGDRRQALAQLFGAGGALGEVEIGCGRLQVRTQEASMMAKARGVDADADQGRRERRSEVGHKRRLQVTQSEWDSSRERPPRIPGNGEACDQRSSRKL
jgi:hypothetical protein